eukprot:353621_1
MYMWCSPLLYFLFAIIVASVPYTVPHIDHTISWITSNSNDESVIYLGNKSNSTECEASCKYLNYLCDKSESDIGRSDGASFSFNNANCEITINGGNEPWMHITPNLISTQYRIDVELSVISGYEAGILFKSNDVTLNVNDSWLDYYTGIRPDPLDEPGVVLGYSNPNYWQLRRHEVNPQIMWKTKYTLSVDVNGNNFTAYFEGASFYTGFFLSKWVDSYAGIYTEATSVTYYSYKLNITDGEGERVCAAYVMDKNSGDCYGYYGTDYTQMENTLSSNSNYDAAIIYPFLPATNEPSSFPSDEPSKMPSDIHHLISIANEDTTDTPTTGFTQTSSSFTFTETDGFHSSDRVNKSHKAILLSIVGVVLIICFMAALFFIYVKNHKQQQSVDEMVITGGDENANYMTNNVQNINFQSSFQTDLELAIQQRLQQQNIVSEKQNNVTPDHDLDVNAAPRRTSKWMRNALLVKEWLNDIGMGQYYDCMISNGYDTMDIIKEIKTKNDLEEIGIDLKSHQALILSQASKLRTDTPQTNGQINVVDVKDVHSDINVDLIEPVATRTGQMNDEERDPITVEGVADAGDYD